jgi:hypothetical protein
MNTDRSLLLTVTLKNRSRTRVNIIYFFIFSLQSASPCMHCQLRCYVCTERCVNMSDNTEILN